VLANRGIDGIVQRLTIASIDAASMMNGGAKLAFGGHLRVRY
jgi:hypothetical protein